MYPEEPGFHLAAVPPVCPGLGLCPLAAGSDVLDPSLAAPESWLMSLALVSSKEVSFQTGQLVHDPGLNFTTHPPDAAVATPAALGEPSPTGGSFQTDLVSLCQMLHLFVSQGPGLSA